MTQLFLVQYTKRKFGFLIMYVGSSVLHLCNHKKKGAIMIIAYLSAAFCTLFSLLASTSRSRYSSTVGNTLFKYLHTDYSPIRARLRQFPPSYWLFRKLHKRVIHQSEPGLHKSLPAHWILFGYRCNQLPLIERFPQWLSGPSSPLSVAAGLPADYRTGFK